MRIKFIAICAATAFFIIIMVLGPQMRMRGVLSHEFTGLLQAQRQHEASISTALAQTALQQTFLEQEIGSLRNDLMLRLQMRRHETKMMLMHRFWTSSSQSEALNRKVRASLLSALHRHTTEHGRAAKVILWTLPSTYEHVKRQAEEFKCGEGGRIEVRSTDQLLGLVRGTPELHKCVESLESATAETVAFSDLVRFIALYLYGGIYVDIDAIVLRDMSGLLLGPPFAYKWDRDVLYYNTAVMGLPKGSEVVLKIIRHFDACTPEAFFPSRIHKALNCTSGVCEELLMMPTALFDPVSAPMSNWQWQTEGVNGIGHTTDWLFDRRRMWSFAHFFPGAYTFHWHNRWEHATFDADSWFADVERLSEEACAPSPPPRAEVSECRSIFVDLGGFTGDTLALYGGGPALKKKENYVFEIDLAKVSEILRKLDGPLAHLKPYTQVFCFIDCCMLRVSDLKE